MKRLLNCLIVALLFASVLTSSRTVFAQEYAAPNTSSMDSSSTFTEGQASPSADAFSSAKSIEYFLPYPGILPDNPLYKLKVLRDKIVLLLISDTLKKSEAELLQADKRLNSAVPLVKKGKEKYALAEETVSKAENYLDAAISDAEKAKKEKREVADMVAKLNTAARKHQEVINLLADMVDEGTSRKLKVQAKRASEMEKRVNLIFPK